MASRSPILRTLIGKEIENVLLSKDRVVIVFVTVEGETFPYSAEGD